MAKDWIQRSIRQITRQVNDVVEKVVRPTTEPTVREIESKGDLKPSTVPLPRPWYDWILDSLPMAMLATGALLAGICVNFESTFIWSIFGFILIAVSPVVFYAQRIDKHLKDWMELQRRWHD